MIGWIAGIVIAAAAVVIIANLWLRGDQIRHRIESLYGAGDPEFRRAISTLLGPTLLEGNRVTALLKGDAIFPAMLEAIRGARRTITFETFINVLSGAIGEEQSRFFDEDLGRAQKVTLEAWRRRPIREKAVERLASLLRWEL